MTQNYYIARNPDVSAATILLSRSSGHDLSTAFTEMGQGVVFDDSGDIVAFHERHYALLAHRGLARMTNAPEAH